jgi:hypothetical protein
MALAARQDTAVALPDESTFLDEVRRNLSRSQQEQYRYAYKERRTELHMNPFGRLGTGATRVYDVVPSADGTIITRRLIERDGKAVDGKPEQRERGERRNRPQSQRGFDDVVETLQFTVQRREIVDRRPFIVISFAARPDARPRTREGKMARVFTGEVWVDEAAREVERIEATAIDNLSVGFGMIARLSEGTTVSVHRRPVIDGLWLPTSLRFVGEGRAMVFRKLQLDYAIDWFDYRSVQ